MTLSKKMDDSIQKNTLFKKEINLLIPFVKAPWKDFTLKEIKLATDNSSHHYVYEGLEKFSKSVLKKEKRGNTNIYKINEENKEIDYFILTEIFLKQQNKQIPYKVLEQIQSKINTSFYTLLITGSYAKNKQTNESDLDILIIVSGSNKKPFEIALKEGELTIPEVHGFVFTEEEFFQMLINKEFNYGKESVKNHIIYHGISSYYKILLKGLQNGFKG